jgi:hypothetical protein
MEWLSPYPACLGEYPDVAQTSQAPAYVVCAAFPTAWFVHEVRFHAYAMKSDHGIKCAMSRRVL